MSTLSTAARNAACNAVVDLLDAGAAAGKLRIRTVGGATLVDIPLSDPAFGNAATGVATGASFPKTATATGTGTAQNAQLLDSDNNVVVSGITVGVGSGELSLDSVDITSGQDVTIDSFTYTQPAS